MDKQFKALIVTEEGNEFKRKVGTKSIDKLPDGDVLVNVKYSSLNYKDALSATGNKGVTRKYPHTPGIDASGIVAESKNSKFKEGDKVIVTSYDLGMNTSGGFGQYIRVPAEWVVRLPEGLSLKESMIYGTAGFTAALGINQIETMGTNPEAGEILVTGASGGVGSLAVALLAKAGYKVTAATGKQDKIEFLKKLGASAVISREEADEKSERPLLKSRWSGVIDTVGGNILANAIKSTNYGGCVATCGLTQSPKLDTTVYPFILRGINLLGIDSAHCTMELREKIWNRLANELKVENLEELSTECSLEELNEKIDLILRGKLVGRTLVNLEL